MKRKVIFAVYHKGPQAMVQLVESLCSRIEKLEAQVQQLENQGKKTPKTATSQKQGRNVLQTLECAVTGQPLSLF